MKIPGEAIPGSTPERCPLRPQPIRSSGRRTGRAEACAHQTTSERRPHCLPALPSPGPYVLKQYYGRKAKGIKKMADLQPGKQAQTRCPVLLEDAEFA